MTTDTVEPIVAADYKPGVRGTDRPPGRGDLGMALIFILPALIGFLVFYLYPFIRGFYFSLTRYNLLGTPHFIGLDNFTRLFQDKLFWNAMLVTVEYVVINIVLQTILAVAIAVLMHRLTQSTVIRGLILLPFLISDVIAAMVWFWLLDYQIGLVNGFIAAIGFDKIPFFGDAAWAIPTIAMVNVWRRMGYTALLVFAGLQTIPNYVYEAAAVDGSTEWKFVLADHLAAAEAGPGAGVGDHGDRLVPGVRHGGSDHEGRAGQCQPRHPVLHLPKGLYRGPVRLCQRPLGDLVHHPRHRCAHPAEDAAGRRIRPGLRGVSHGNRNRSLSRAEAQAHPSPRASGSILAGWRHGPQ